MFDLSANIEDKIFLVFVNVWDINSIFSVIYNSYLLPNDVMNDEHFLRCVANTLNLDHHFIPIRMFSLQRYYHLNPSWQLHQGTFSPLPCWKLSVWRRIVASFMSSSTTGLGPSLLIVATIIIWRIDIANTNLGFLWNNDDDRAFFPTLIFMKQQWWWSCLLSRFFQNHELGDWELMIDGLINVSSF